TSTPSRYSTTWWIQKARPGAGSPAAGTTPSCLTSGWRPTLPPGDAQRPGHEARAAHVTDVGGSHHPAHAAHATHAAHAAGTGGHGRLLLGLVDHEDLGG